MSQSKAFLHDFLADLGDISKEITDDIDKTMGPKDFSMNELSLKTINQTYMDDQFDTANESIDPTVNSYTQGLFSKQSVTSRSGIKQQSGGRRGNVVMKAHSDD